MSTTPAPAGRLHRRVAIPSEHGSWVFLLSPLLIGLLLGGRPTWGSLCVVVAALAAFLIRQPVTEAVKALSGRRPIEVLPVARLWVIVYGVVLAAASAGLLALGLGYLFLLAIPAAPVLVWHEVLISKRAERKQMLLEVVGSGALALGAPAAYWAAVSAPTMTGWWLWALTWAFSAASIVHAYLRLAQRVLKAVPPMPERLRMALPALCATGVLTLVVLVLGVLGLVAGGLWLAYAIQFIETVFCTVRPAVGERPARIGARQTIVSGLFTLAFAALWGRII